MSNSSTALMIAIFWFVFMALVYTSVLRADVIKLHAPNQQKGKKKQSQIKTKEISPLSIVGILAVIFVIRVVIAATGTSALIATSSLNRLFETLTKQNQLFAYLQIPAILADCVSAFFLYQLAQKHTKLSAQGITTIVALWAINPYSIFATVSFAQTASFAFFFLFLAIYLLDFNKIYAWILSGVSLAFAVLIQGEILYFIPLLLLYLFFQWKENKNILPPACTVFAFAFIYVLSIIILDQKYVFLFTPSIHGSVNQLLNLPTANAFNFYSLFDSWKESWYTSGSLQMNSRLFRLTVTQWGYIGFGFSILSTALLYLRSNEKKNIFYYCGLLTVTALMFVTGMSPFFILPAVLFFYADFAVSGSFGSLIVGFLASVAGLLNIGHLALNRLALDVFPHNATSIIVPSALALLAAVILGFYYGVHDHGTHTANAPALSWQPLALGKTKKMQKLDWALLAVFTLVALFSNFYQLGDRTAPSTMWDAAKDGRETVVEVQGSPTHMSYFLSLGETGQALQADLSVETSADGQNWTPLNSVSDKGYSYTWYDVSLANSQKYMKITENSEHMKILEIGFYNNNRELLPVKVVSGCDKAFDEQQYAKYGKTYMNSMYFDEVYHGRTAYEVTQGINEYEWTHPPFGKLLMGVGIRTFGMNPFGWRFMGALLGVLLVPLMYLFGKKLFARTLPACGMAFLMLFDNFRFAQSRIATIDTYVVFFIILMYYFMYDFYSADFKSVTKPWQLWRPLLFSGISFGFACATKWTGFYAGAGLALLFFLAFYRMSKENPKLFRQFAVPTIGLCVIFFVLIPFVIYFASYLPHLSMFDDKWKEFKHQQEAMYNYHSKLESTHSYSSAWYMWPFMIRPVYMSSGGAGNANGTVARIAGIGNPAIWWMLLPAFILFLFLIVKARKDKRFSFLIIGFLSQYLPWVLVSRTTYQYHFFTSLPFLFAMLVYGLFWLKDHFKWFRYVLYAYGAIVVAAFILYFPVVSGMELPQNSPLFDMIRAFDTWNFF